MALAVTQGWYPHVAMLRPWLRGSTSTRRCRCIDAAGGGVQLSYVVVGTRKPVGRRRLGVGGCRLSLYRRDGIRTSPCLDHC